MASCKIGIVKLVKIFISTMPSVLTGLVEIPVISNMCDESIVTDAVSTPLFTALTSAAVSIKNIRVPPDLLSVFTCIVGATLPELP